MRYSLLHCGHWFYYKNEFVYSRKLTRTVIFYTIPERCDFLFEALPNVYVFYFHFSPTRNNSQYHHSSCGGTGGIFHGSQPIRFENQNELLYNKTFLKQNIIQPTYVLSEYQSSDLSHMKHICSDICINLKP